MGNNNNKIMKFEVITDVNDNYITYTRSYTDINGNIAIPKGKQLDEDLMVISIHEDECFDSDLDLDAHCKKIYENRLILRKANHREDIINDLLT